MEQQEDHIWKHEKFNKNNTHNSEKEGRKEMFYLTTHSTHFVFTVIWRQTYGWAIQIGREETRCRHIDLSFWLAARALLYASSHIQDNTYHGLCYTSRGALAGTGSKNTFMKPHHI